MVYLFIARLVLGYIAIVSIPLLHDLKDVEVTAAVRIPNHEPPDISGHPSELSESHLQPTHLGAGHAAAGADGDGHHDDGQHAAGGDIRAALAHHPEHRPGGDRDCGLLHLQLGSHAGLQQRPAPHCLDLWHPYALFYQDVEGHRGC